MNSKNSLFKVTPKDFVKSILVPTSKSYSNRALILGALNGQGFTLSNISTSSDVTNLLKAFVTIGLEFTKSENQIIFLNSFPECESKTTEQVIDLETGDGGTTNRFLIALLSRGQKTYRLFPMGKINERPIDDLINPLRELDVDIESNNEGAWISVCGPANITLAKTIEIDCAKSTQFASAMLLAFNNTPISFSFKNLHASEKYLQMTKAVVKELNTTPVDFSSASYPIALALICGDVKISNCLSIDPFQADSSFVEIAKNCGADIRFSKDGLCATSKKVLRPFIANGADFPDLVPTLAFLASRIVGESRLENLSVLRHKESDRINELIKLLTAFQVKHKFISESDSLIINGSLEKVPFITYFPVADHRMVMTAYLFMRANSGGLLGNIECVTKSYPSFFEELD